MLPKDRKKNKELKKELKMYVKKRTLPVEKNFFSVDSDFARDCNLCSACSSLQERCRFTSCTAERSKRKDN